MSFSNWLQWIFVPRLQYMLETESPLPGKSAMHPMAEEAWKEMGTTAKGALESVKRLDGLLSQ